MKVFITSILNLMANVCILSLIPDVYLGTYGMSLGRKQEEGSSLKTNSQTNPKDVFDSLSGNLKVTVDDHNVIIIPPDPSRKDENNILGARIVLQPKASDDKDKLQVDTNIVREEIKKYFESNGNLVSQRQNAFSKPQVNPEDLKLTVDDNKVIIIPSEVQDQSRTNNSKLGTRIVIYPLLSEKKIHSSHVDTSERRKQINEYFEANDTFYSKNKNILPNLETNPEYESEDKPFQDEIRFNEHKSDLPKSNNDLSIANKTDVDILSQITDRPLFSTAENLFVEKELLSEAENVQPTNNDYEFLKDKNGGDVLDKSEFVTDISQMEIVSLISTNEPDIFNSDGTVDSEAKNAQLNTKSSDSGPEDFSGSMDNFIAEHTTQFVPALLTNTIGQDILHSEDAVDFEIQKVPLNTNSLDNVIEGSGTVDDAIVRHTTADPNISGRFLGVFSGNSNCTTPLGESGKCKSISECTLKDAMENFSLFLDYVCLHRSTFVGICCPDNPDEEVTDEKDEENTKDKAVEEFKQPSEGCGLSQKTRIVGGTISVPHEWSWMVALLRRNRFFCGGVIINDRYVLTAAHCVLGIRIKDLSVRLGEYNFQERTEHERDIGVQEIKRHRMFVTMTFQHDIALLKLKQRIEYSKFIGSICLPERTGRDYSDVKAIVVGWGTVSFGGSASPILRQVSIPVWDQAECDKTYVLENINEAFVCAGSPENGEDACQGDSGGPLMTTNNQGRWEVMGIVSWGRRCGDPTFPGVYTNVTNYLEWIQENID